MSKALSVLVVDDVAEIRGLARTALEQRGLRVLEAEDAETALAVVADGAVDLVVLDVQLPRLSGLGALRRLRQESSVPVILLTSLQEEADRVLGLELGADDYVVKPFSPAELGARVQSVLRRSGAGRAPAEAAEQAPAPPGPGLVLSVEERRVLVDGAPVELTPKEFDLLACLARAPRVVHSRDQLLERVWGSAPGWQDAATVTEHVRRLRRKIEADPERPRWIHTVRGVGYRFEPA